MIESCIDLTHVVRIHPLILREARSDSLSF